MAIHGTVADIAGLAKRDAVTLLVVTCSLPTSSLRIGALVVRCLESRRLLRIARSMRRDREEKFSFKSFAFNPPRGKA